MSAERGERVTAEICFSASGEYMPPYFIFPRARVNPEFCEGAPSGATIEFHPSGYMKSHIFYKWMHKFIEFSKPTQENKVL